MVSNSVDSGFKVIEDDPYLRPYADSIRERFGRYKEVKAAIEESEKCTLVEFAGAYKVMGLHRTEGGVRYREWAPNAHRLTLMGDFNGWDPRANPLGRLEFGFWELFLPDGDGAPAIAHGSKVKVCVWVSEDDYMVRIPAWITYCVQEGGGGVYDGVFWDPPEKYEFKYERPAVPAGLRIYETHIGMAASEPRIGTYAEFKDVVLDYVVDLGYNAIQIMAIMEHAYYASFGYQVTNFFAPCSRYGTCEEFKELVDEAHRRGLLVFLDVVHSHASRNTEDGLNNFDGSGHQYFHDGPRGFHSIWDSRLFNYGSWEVKRFLLSNLRYWVEEYRIDGFRFDGVMTMIYHSRGIGGTPTRYDEYFGPIVDQDAMVYLMLANDMLHSLHPNILTLAEEVSGFPTMCRPIEEGGIGFDYRFGMGIPDKWIELLKKPDEEWNMGNLVHALTNRRWKEKTIAYAECHDQALVGDKTIAFWLMDKEMYTEMTTLKEKNIIIDRGIALHKMIRLITMSLGGEGYLTFMGNEFGHPEWIDFPRSGNNWSYHYAFRRWYLAKDHLLRYQYLHRFERCMNKLEDRYRVFQLSSYVSLKHESDKVIVYERGNLVFVFNFHPTQSYFSYLVGVPSDHPYQIILDSDWKEFDGHCRNDPSCVFHPTAKPQNNRPFSMQVYSPSRTAVVYCPVDECKSSLLD
ncbi:LOW QUALITY PROTEIN: 1,4-alpha-glucan-branching enzyme-like [Schistocerca gregaria]|uniref:LOW QUALITY PROTEIN: 1,4-alpha-glucan-branching enzyme-like n=1 Tax=Schistocerca gregaria TaxID=7010 RepID=UPI00211E4075|nr:LOW QUALITY PROTEIN: 1,4-alpha-glucan-branching enzyme-like [Schistocerca gregaria]